MQSYYEELGIDSSATQDEISAAFRRLAKKYHPDLNVGREQVSRVAFLRVQTAFDLLSDPARRARYDSELDASSNHWGLPPSANGVEIQPIQEFQIHPSSMDSSVTLPPAPRRLDPELRKVFIFVGICVVLAMAVIFILT
jgi:DnaJ-class molecular chaperone